jgi:hypothetical protein
MRLIAHKPPMILVGFAFLENRAAENIRRIWWLEPRRLSIDLTVYGARKQLSKGVYVHIGGVENEFGEVLSCPAIVVVGVVTATWPLAIPADPLITSAHAKINRCIMRFKLFMTFTRGPLTEK